MKYSEPGVIGESTINFTIPSGFARSALYCCPEVGYFYCNDKYDIRRETKYDWFLMCFICRGSLTFQAGGPPSAAHDRSEKEKAVTDRAAQEYTANENEVVLLDCRAPHRYFCTDSAEFIWFHFYGNSSIQYAEYLLSHGGIVFSGEQVRGLRQSFTSIYRQAGSAFVNEHLLSREISNILCSLATSQRSASLIQSPVTPALNHINRYYSEPIDLDEMAKLCMISKPHLIRCFKKELGCTPHDYLLDYRLRQAKELLVSSSRTVEEIAEECGFNSISHFSRAFKGRIGMSPSEYRGLW
ncbi:MAG: AraC family transcriptional regulator [Eubacteriales bacterium]|nr:AraC family transcriptional regulator [Eubacteriales bacterium]